MNHISRSFPELSAGGFTRRDGTIEFFTRVNSLIGKDMTVVDFGAGRGKFLEAPDSFRKNLQLLRTKVKSVIGLDVDQAVLENQSVDSAYVIRVGSKVPLSDASVDIIVSDFTFEHVDDVTWLAQEFDRILRPGGWICARTPNKWGYVGIITRLVPNRFHEKFLRKLQPAKNAQDTFPTRYRINTRRSAGLMFPSPEYENCSYSYSSEPSYGSNSSIIWKTLLLVDYFMPRHSKSTLMIFLRKRR